MILPQESFLITVIVVSDDVRVKSHFDSSLLEIEYELLTPTSFKYLSEQWCRDKLDKTYINVKKI